MRAPMVASLAAALLYGIGAVLQSLGAQRGGGHPGWRGLLRIATQGPYVAGLACDLVGWLLMIYAVRHLPLFAVQTVLAGSLIVTASLSWAVLHTPLRSLDLAAIGVAIVGLTLVGTAADTGEAVSPRAAVPTMLVIVLPIGVLVGAFVLRGVGPVLVACVAGVMFSLSATSVRTIEAPHSVGGLLRQPLAWAVIGYAASALALHARALERGRVGPVTAAIWSTEIVVASVVGFLLLGDSVRPGGAVVAVVGMTMAIGATIVLANAPATARPA